MKKIISILFLIFLFSCSTAYYNVLEKFGYEKRDILISRVQDTKESQEDVQDQFKSTYEAFRNVVKVENSELEDAYFELKEEFDVSNKRANELRKHVESVDKVANDLFDEWEDELDTYSNMKLKARSRDSLQKTRLAYRPLIKSMREAEARVEPVLTVFGDQVLYLKHNLNASTISSIKGELYSVENQVEGLISALEQSISKADKFINNL